MKQIFDLFRPKGFLQFKSTIHSTTEGELSIEGQTRAFTFTLFRHDREVMHYVENEDHVFIDGALVPVMCRSWKNFPLELVLNGKHYTHRFNRFLWRKYAMHHSVYCDGAMIADLTSRIDSVLLGFKLGGRLKLELLENIPFWEPLFFSIAWWWSGYYTDSTTT